MSSITQHLRSLRQFVIYPQATIPSILQRLGTVAVGRVAWRFLRWTLTRLLPEVPLIHYRPPNAWALVTGSSAGIGLGVALALAKLGLNIVLLGHREEELQTAQQTITETFPNATTRIIVVDAITATPNRISELMEELKDLNLTILVNNIGGIPTTRSQYYNRIDTSSAQLLQQTVALNAGFMAQLTRVAIPYLSRNGPSLILNVASASLLGYPGAATYSDTKAFVPAFSKAVAREMRADGLSIDVTVAMLGEVRTQANPVGPFGSPDADAFGEAMIANVGRAIQTQSLVYHPWFGHAIQDFLMDNIPTYLLEWILKQVFHEKRGSQER